MQAISVAFVLKKMYFIVKSLHNFLNFGIWFELFKNKQMRPEERTELKYSCPFRPTQRVDKQENVFF